MENCLAKRRPVASCDDMIGLCMVKTADINSPVLAKKKDKMVAWKTFSRRGFYIPKATAENARLDLPSTPENPRISAWTPTQVRHLQREGDIWNRWITLYCSLLYLYCSCCRVHFGCMDLSEIHLLVLYLGPVKLSRSEIESSGARRYSSVHRIHRRVYGSSVYA